MNHITLNVPVKDRSAQLSDQQQNVVRAFLSRLEGKAVEIRYSKPVTKRSLQQNSYYWGPVLTTIAESTGNTTEDLHLICKDLFLPRKFIKLGNKEIEVRKTTTDLTPDEFTHYLTQIQAWASSELGIAIPSTT